MKLIEEWVEKEIMPNELLLILEAVLMPMLVTSILAELMVNKGNKYKRAYSGHQSREVINAQAEQKWNVVDKEITMAWEEYMRSDEIKEKAEKMRQETSKTWRRKGQPVVRTPSALKNKPMLLLLQRQRRVRLAKITPDVQKGAKAHHKCASERAPTMRHSCSRNQKRGTKKRRMGKLICSGSSPRRALCEGQLRVPQPSPTP